MLPYLAVSCCRCVVVVVFSRRNETVEIAFHVVVSRQFEDVTGVYVNVDGKRHELYKR